MSFIARHVVTADERLIYIARLHWIYLAKGLIWLGVIMGIEFVARAILIPLYGSVEAYRPIYINGISFGYPAAWFFWFMLFCGLLILWTYIAMVLGTEIALTNNRVILKTGLIAAEAREAELSEIKTEIVHQGLFGRFIGYGWVHMDCRFVGDFDLPVIRNPYRFLQAMHKARGTHSEPIV